MITVHLRTIWLANPFSMIMFQAGICGVVAEGLDDPEPLDYNSPDKRVPYYRNNCKRHIDQRSNCCSLRKLEYNGIITEKVPDRNWRERYLQDSQRRVQEVVAFQVCRKSEKRLMAMSVHMPSATYFFWCPARKKRAEKGMPRRPAWHSWSYPAVFQNPDRQHWKPDIP